MFCEQYTEFPHHKGNYWEIRNCRALATFKYSHGYWGKEFPIGWCGNYFSDKDEHDF